MSKQYNAFISYSHANARHVVEAVHKQMQTYAKPWYKMRAVELFRDETDLAANPNLWSTIQGAIDCSEYLILIASPEAASSKWVKREIRYWLGERDVLKTPEAQLDQPVSHLKQEATERLLIALVDGELTWVDGSSDQTHGYFNAQSTTALPSVLLETFKQEPLWVDLRPFVINDGAQLLSDKNPAFMAAVARLLAPVRGMPLRDLIGEDNRQHRKTVRTASVAAIALLALTVTALVFGQIAKKRAMHNLAQRIAAEAREQHQRFRNDELASLLALKAMRLNEQYGGEGSNKFKDTLYSIIDADYFSYILDTGGGWQFTTTFSPDSNWLIVAGRYGKILAWNLSQPRKEVELLGETDVWVRDLKFIPGSLRFLVSGDSEEMHIWDLADRSFHHKFNAGMDQRVTRFAVNGSRGLLAAGGENGSIALFDLKNLTLPIQINGGHDRRVSDVTFSPDGRYLISVSLDETLKIWDLEDYPGEPRVFSEQGGPLKAVRMSPDGQLLFVAGEDDKGVSRVRAWIWPDLQAAELNVPVPAKTLAFNGNGNLLAADSDSAFDSRVRLWDRHNLVKPPVELVGHESRVWSVAFSPNGQYLASVGEEGLVRLWRLKSPLRRVFKMPGTLWQVDVRADGTAVAAGGFDGNVRVWGLHEGEQSERKFSVSDQAFSVKFRPNSNELAIATFGEVILWNLSTKKSTSRSFTERLSDTVRDIDFDVSGRWMAAVSETGPCMWDLDAPAAPPVCFAAPKQLYFSVAIDDAAKQVAVGNISGELRIWEVDAPSEDPKVLKRHSQRIRGLEFDSLGDRLISAGEDGAVVLSERRNSWKSKTIIGNHVGAANSVSFLHGDSSIFSVGSDGVGRIWDLQDELRHARQFRTRFKTVSFISGATSSDGSVVVAGGYSTGEVYVWQLIENGLERVACENVWRDLTPTEWEEFIGKNLDFHSIC